MKRSPLSNQPIMTVASISPSGPIQSAIERLSANRAVLAILDQGIVSGTSFLTSMLVGRCLGKESLGIFILVTGLFVILQCVVDQLIHVPYLVFAPHLQTARLRQYTSSAAMHCVLLTGAAILLIVVGSLCTRWLDLQSSQFFTSLLILAGCLPGLMLRDFMHNYFHNRLRQFDAVVLDAQVALLQVAGLITLLAFGWLTIDRALWIIGLSAAAAALLTLSRFRTGLDFKFQSAWPDFVSNWPIGKWALGSYLVGSSASTILPWFLTAMRGTEATGLLAACLTIAGIAQMMLRGAGKYMAPRLVAAYACGLFELRRCLIRILIFSLLFMTPIALGLTLAGEVLVEFIFGNQFSNTGLIMLVLAVGCWLQTADVVVGNGLLALARSNLNFVSDCLRCLTIIAVVIATVPAQGPLGAALALTTGVVTALIARAICLVNLLGRRDGKYKSPIGEVVMRDVSGVPANG